MSEWKIDVDYKINDVVLYDNHHYKCRINHKSIVTWEPSVDTLALWLPLDNKPDVVDQTQPNKPAPTPAPTPAPAAAPVPTPVTKPDVPVQNNTDNSQKDTSLKTLLKGQRPLGAYFESWSS